MKTFKIISAVLVLILSAAATLFSANISKNGQNTANPVIRHQVNVVFTVPEVAICNVYTVEIHDGSGRLIAPAKRFIPGETTYVYYERGPADGFRVAVLKMAQWPHHYICEQELFTDPAVLKGPFENGQTYRYDLFPKLQQGRGE